MYSLISASVLACDLARHPSGAAVADTLDRVLALEDPRDLGTPAAAQVRERVLMSLAAAPRMSRLMDGVTATLKQGLPDNRTSRTVLLALVETPLGGLEDLHTLLVRERPGISQVALDAVTVAWVGREAGLHDLQVLGSPWAALLDPVPPALPQATYTEVLSGMLEEVSRRTPQQWQRTADAHGAHRGTFVWSTSMHAACVAAYEADRVTDVARAQLSAARALRLSGASTGPDAHAIAMAVTAAVQAVCTADLLDSPALRMAWEAGS